MQIALLGGSGDIGEGIGLRIARDTSHDVVIGSRRREKAEDAAASYRNTLAPNADDSRIVGASNETAASEGDFVIVCVPPRYVLDTVQAVRSDLKDDTVVVSPCVRMSRNETGFHYQSSEVGSVAEEISDVLPDQVPVVGAFQNLAAGALTDLDRDLDLDVVVTGDDDESKQKVTALLEGIEGLGTCDAGALANSREVESLTPLLINLSMNNSDLHDLGVKFR
ncbi:NADPH-dependent F420 reductase [Halococcus salsus]|uniref:NADPH-dependent F420 reductase n=1 Tax=Halococcus salsus TaxID=2162894 RepID=UPI0013587D27|nr:NADPH-dependent F420 reductase [Halococcus salsus]